MLVRRTSNNCTADLHIILTTASYERTGKNTECILNTCVFCVRSAAGNRIMGRYWAIFGKKLENHIRKKKLTTD